MHAMLGLGASHLTSCRGMNHSVEALTHRVKAVRLLQSQVPCWSNTKADTAQSSSLRIVPDNDARFAASLALAFQASHMSDGMDEFLWMIRGCSLAFGEGIKLKDSVFRSFSREKHTEAIWAINKSDTSTNVERTDELEAASASVKTLRPLCQSTLQLAHLAALEGILNRAKTSYIQAFDEVALFYNLISEMSSDNFRSFMEISNFASRLILAHFLVVEFMIAAVALQAVSSTFAFRQRVIGDWVIGIAKALPPSHRSYISWPLDYSQAVQAASNGVTLQVLQR
jgi:hypothetical protein